VKSVHEGAGSESDKVKAARKFFEGCMTTEDVKPFDDLMYCIKLGAGNVSEIVVEPSHFCFCSSIGGGPKGILGEILRWL